jgi:hypothetical protein
LRAEILNGETKPTPAFWDSLRKSTQLLYVSPEMALGNRFAKELWLDAGFRSRLTTIAIDEAHCIVDWGKKTFRPQYRELDKLRAYTGHKVPIFACSATVDTTAFDVIWKTLAYGYRPFWGLDVGIARSNLTYIIRRLHNPKQPFLDILNLFPKPLSDTTVPSDIEKMVIYCETQDQCCQTVMDIRKCLPSHLRDCVYNFSSDISDEGKEELWSMFAEGSIRVLCATDAAGMGCNVADIMYSIILGPKMPRFLSSVSQRWGRATRNRSLHGVCLLLVEDWALRPALSTINCTISLIRGRKAPHETKAAIKRHAEMNPPLEKFLNLPADNPKGSSSSISYTPDTNATIDCCHHFIGRTFRPDTKLNIRKGLFDDTIMTWGSRSRGSAFQLTWTVLDIGKSPPREKCCYLCNDKLLGQCPPADKYDPWLCKYAKDFIFPHPDPRSQTQRPSSRASTASVQSQDSDYHPVAPDTRIPKEDKDRLRKQLICWREARWERTGSSNFMAPEVHLPDNLVNLLLRATSTFLEAPSINHKLLLNVIKWGSADDEDVDAVVRIINDWRIDVAAALNQKVLADPQPLKRAKSSQTSTGRVIFSDRSSFCVVILPLLTVSSRNKFINAILCYGYRSG